MPINTRKINGFLIHLDSVYPFALSIEVGKQVSSFEGATVEALMIDLESLKVCKATLSKIKKTALFLIESHLEK